MEVFSLMAKLTLDTKEYEKSLQQAEAEAHNMDDPESPSLGLDKSEFDSKIAEAEEVDVDNPDSPELDLDKQPFDDKVADAEKTDVDNPDSPELDLVTDPYKESLDQAQADTETWSATIGDIFEGLKGVLAAAGITAVVSGIVTNLSEAVDLARSVGDNIDKQSRAMSISTDAYQEWSHVLDINGASITDLNRGLMNMRKLMGGGDAPEEFSKAMVKLGLATEDAEGNISSQFSSTEEMLKSAMKALADFDTSTQDKLAERDYLAQAIFDRGGTKLNAMFDGTSEDIDALIQQAHELGLVMSEESVANAAAYNDAVTNMNASFEAFKISITESILPALTEVANTVASVIAFFNPRTQQKTLSDMFADKDNQLAKDLVTIEGTSGAALDLIDKLFKMGEAEKLTAEQQEEWKQTAEWLVNNIPSLSSVIDLDTQSINGNKDAISENIKEWEKMEKQRAISAAIQAKQQAMDQQNQEALDKVANARAKGFEIAEKENEQISEANRLLRENSQLSQMFSSAFGTTEIDKSAENLQQMLNWLSDVGYEFADTTNYQKIGNDLASLRNEQSKLVSEASDAQKQLDDANRQFEFWKQAITEMYGGTEDEAAEATSDVEELDKALEKLPKQKQIQIDLLVSELTGIDLPPKAKGDWNVPYDMPVYVHRGERILTASQARQGESSGYGTSEIVGAISGLRNDLQQLQLVVGAKTFGRAVVDYGGNRVDNYIGSSGSKRDAGYGT